MIKLTDWETGGSIYIRDADEIKVMVSLKAEVFERTFGCPQECGERTRVDLDGGRFLLVHESPEEILKLLEKVK